MFEGTGVFTKENLDNMLKELAKEFKRRNGTAVPAEIILIGGAAVLVGYGFREMTTDVDAVIHASSAMKLRSGRKYKNDLSDIIGILAEHESRGNSISKDKIDMAVCNLYGSWDGFPEDSVSFINDALEKGSYEAVYAAIREEEKNSKDMLVQVGEKYPGVTTQSNVNEIFASLKAKSDKYQKPSMIGQFREFKEQQGMLLEKKEPSENKVLSEGNASGQQLKKDHRDTER